MTKTVLKLENIKKSFFLSNQEIPVIKNANLEIKSGEIVSLIGPSGSGKTTILQIAGLLDNASLGQVFIGSRDVSKSDDKVRTEIRKNNIGFVFQFHNLLPEFSAIENVAIPLLIQGKVRAEALLEAKKILQEVGLEDRLNHKPSELSGGQQQRVAIARAVVTKPALILADEPTGNLDSEMSLRVFDILKNLALSHDIGCLVVTHNLELAKKTNRVISIKDGVIN
jgi:lipoprotein-releasing system ATP-binding protein